MGFLRASLLVAVAAVVSFVGPKLFEKKTEGKDVVGKDTMRAIHFSSFGHTDDVLEMLDVPVPSFGDKQLLVKVHAAALNPADYKIVAGNFAIADFLFTHRPGFDFAGTVVAVGPGCTRFKVGDAVHGMTAVTATGSLAEYLAVDEAVAALKPHSQSFEQAAGLPLVAHTSHVIAPLVNEKSRVLVLGGGTATGMAAIQIARVSGAAEIVTTCSPRNEALVKSLGANSFVNYRETDVWEFLTKNNKQFDVIYDTIGGSSPEDGAAVWNGASAGVLARGGHLVTITGDTQGPLTVIEILKRGWQLVSRNAFTLFQMGGAVYHQYTQFAGDSVELTEMNEAGIEVKLDTSAQFHFTLDDVKAAFRLVRSGKANGKVVVSIAP